MERGRRGRRHDGERQMLIAGLLLIAVVTVTDIVTGDSFSLIGYLVLGPLVAATRARPRVVLAVGLVALVAAFPLGIANDMFLELRHFVALGLVTAGGLIAALLAGSLGDLRTNRARELLAHKRLALIDRSSRLIAAPFNVATRLEELTRLPIPDLAPVCAVDLLREDGTIGGVIVSAADKNYADAVREARERFPLDPEGTHPAAVVLRTGTPRLIAEIDDQILASLPSEHAEMVSRMQYGSAVVAPLIARGRKLGVMSLLRFRDQPPFDEADFAVVTDLAARASVAVDNARLFDGLRDTEGRLEAILSVIAEAVTVQDREGKLVYVNEAAKRLLGAAGAVAAEAVLEQSPETILSNYEMFDEHGAPLEVERLPGRAALRGETPQPLVVRWIDRRTGDERWTMVKASAVRDEDGVPMLAVNIIEDITEERQRAERAALLAEASNLLASASEFEAGLSRLADTLAPRVAETCSIALLDERDELATVASAGGVDTFEETDLVLATARPILREDGTVLVAPLLAGDRAIGVLTLSRRDTLRRFGGDDLLLADELGRRVGLAVEHARVHRERTHIASTLQRSLLPPRLPSIAGMNIAARFRAAGASNQVGGDFYDVFDVEGGWIVVIGDVTGKGADAAAITALARYTVRTAARYEPAPSDILDRLNEALLREAGERRRLCTAICLRIEDSGGDHPIRATFACAGHPPPYLLSNDEVAELSTPGPLLGAFEDASWEQATLEIASGDSLVLYTDGVTDAHGAGDERFGDDRLRSVLGRAPRGDASSIAAAVDDALEEFQEGPQRDDVALLVLKAARDDAGIGESAVPIGDAI